MIVHGFGGSKTLRAPQPKQSCSCKTNADGRCCASKLCGCVKAGVGCSPSCFCRGFARVCANPEEALPKAAPKAPKEGPPPAKKAKEAPPAFGGASRKLADDPWEKAAAPSEDAGRAAFLARLEREAADKRRAQQAEAAEAAAAAEAEEAAATAEVKTRQQAPPVPRADAADDVVDLCDSSSDDERASAPTAALALAGPSSAPAPAAAAAAAAAAARLAAGPAPAAARPPAATAAKPPAAASRSLPPPAPSAALTYDPFGNAGYKPPGGFAAARELCVRERAALRCVGGGWVDVRAVLDTGNEGPTLVGRAAAVRAGLIDARTGLPAGDFGQTRFMEACWLRVPSYSGSDAIAASEPPGARRGGGREGEDPHAARDVQD